MLCGWDHCVILVAVCFSRETLYFLLALPLPCHIPTEYKYTDTSQPKLFFLHLPRKMEPIAGSETSTFKPQTPGKYPKENILLRSVFILSNTKLYDLTISEFIFPLLVLCKVLGPNRPILFQINSPTFGKVLPFPLNTVLSN